ncbi:MAG TPA: phytoene/squalene synthase family protein [Beijerinckiaceae bacterium]|nr:phytoene/squalene synthase family protein [Beijerinckiaceae bacterium]
MTACAPSDPALSAAYQAAQATVRALDEDRYLATLFAPEAARPHLFALYAFSAEISRVRSQVREAMPGEIRFQWWRDFLNGKPHGDASGHPLARALSATIGACALPVKPLLDLIEARTFDLYDDPMPTWLDCEGYCGETSSALIQLACLCLTGGSDPGAAQAAGHAGVAYALTGLLRAFPWTSRRGQLFLPADVFAAHGVKPEAVRAGQDSPGLRAALGEIRARAGDHLAKTRALIGTVSPAIAPAFLPVAMVDPYLKTMARADYDPFRSRVEVGKLAKLWRFWRQARCAGI